MAESSDANKDYSEASGRDGGVKTNVGDKSGLPKQESLVLYTQAALSGGRMSSGTATPGRRARPALLKQISETPGPLRSPRRRAAVVKQDTETDNTGRKYVLSHQDTPHIIISTDCDGGAEQDADDGDADDEDDDGPMTPLPVLPIELPEPDSEDEDDGRNDSEQLSAFLGITQRYRRSSLVRMDAVQQPASGGNALEAPTEAPVRKLSVHGSLDLPKNTLKDLVGFRKAQSFSAEDSEEDDTVAISDLPFSGKSGIFLRVPGETHGKHKRKGSKKKRPSLRRLLTITTEPQLDREELEERRNCRKREKEERKKERLEKKKKEKQKEEEEKYDEDGVSISLLSPELKCQKEKRLWWQFSNENRFFPKGCISQQSFDERLCVTQVSSCQRKYLSVSKKISVCVCAAAVTTVCR